jgi:hypothetical protein
VYSELAWVSAHKKNTYAKYLLNQLDTAMPTLHMDPYRK